MRLRSASVTMVSGVRSVWADSTSGVTQELVPRTTLRLLLLSATLAVMGCHLSRRGAEALRAEPKKVAV